MSKKANKQEVDKFQLMLKKAGRDLETARKDQGLKVQDMAAATGISRLTISMAERGKLPNPHFKMYFIMADALGLSLNLSINKP